MFDGDKGDVTFDVIVTAIGPLIAEAPVDGTAVAVDETEAAAAAAAAAVLSLSVCAANAAALAKEKAAEGPSPSSCATIVRVGGGVEDKVAAVFVPVTCASLRAGVETAEIITSGDISGDRELVLLVINVEAETVVDDEEVKFVARLFSTPDPDVLSIV